MSTFNELHSQLTTYNEALDRVSDKIVNLKNDQYVKVALIKQYVELKRQKAIVESKIQELEHQKILD